MTTQTIDERATPQYGIIFAVLAIFTALEAGTAYLPNLPVGIKVAVLVFLAVVKVLLVLLYFMHLKFDSKIFALPFGLGIVLITPLFLIVGLTMNQSPVTASAESAPVNSSGQIIDVTEVSFNIHMSQITAQAGPMTFHIVNGADDMLHEFIIIKTDSAPENLPTNMMGRVQEDAVTIITAAEDIPPANSRNINVNLASGHYVMICNLPGHYLQGMRVEFTVTGNQVGTPTTPESTPVAQPSAEVTASS